MRTVEHRLVSKGKKKNGAKERKWGRLDFIRSGMADVIGVQQAHLLYLTRQLVQGNSF